MKATISHIAIVAFEPAELLLPRPLPVLGEHPPIFIVGAPRCGSTLLTQVLVGSLGVSYLSNRHARLPGAPALVERFARPHVGSNWSYTSDLGATRGASGPSESAAWWYRFFPRSPAYVPAGRMPATDGIRFARSVATLTYAGGRPVLFKNLFASLRIRAIVECVPDARFIWIQRSVTENALSILAARRKRTLDERAWFSVPPPGWEEARELAPAEQAVWQVRATNQVIARDLSEAGVGPDRLIRIRYEEFCAAPRDGVEAVKDAFLLSERGSGSIAAVPSAFATSAHDSVPDAVRAAVAARPRSRSQEAGPIVDAG